MKHTMRITLLLIAFFVISQLVGLAIVSQYINIQESAKTKGTVLNEEIYIVEPPKVENESMSWIAISLMIMVATAIVLLLVKFKQRKVWKAWFLLSVTVALSLAFAPFLWALNKTYLPGIMNLWIYATLCLALALAVYKIYRPNPVIHNLTEIFIYGGIAALLVPIINLFSAIILLVIISLYDMYAVWKSKHMVSMAKFQSESKVFAGLMVRYDTRSGKVLKEMPSPPKPSKRHTAGPATNATKTVGGGRSAILGGGDIAFPLIFSGALMKYTGGFGAALIVTAFAAAGLYTLFMLAEKDKFYPAMPPVTFGCFVGLGIAMLAGLA